MAAQNKPVLSPPAPMPPPFPLRPSPGPPPASPLPTRRCRVCLLRRSVPLPLERRAAHISPDHRPASRLPPRQAPLSAAARPAFFCHPCHHPPSYELTFSA